ncbi:MAG TPA: tetratricopeptide repeat protein [Bryobacteraceae bacterium]|nr:tetratricopeptide repeat protein [Bryobacteraceae bacterium]
MAKTWHGSVTSLLPRDYAGRVAEGTLVYEIRRDGDQFVYSTLVPPAPKVTLPVQVIMGGERHGLSFLVSIEKLGGIPLERRALIEARYVYNTPHHALALSPGFPTETPRSYETAFGRTISPTFEKKCLTCHGEPETLGAGKQGGVHCESCHGPGAEHVQAISQGKTTGIVNPRKLPADESLEICAQCHVGFSFHSDPLPKELLVSSQVPALRSSECFIQSGKGFGCAACHNPHRDAPRAEVIKASMRACLGCHSSQVQQHAGICPVNANTGCIECHMPVTDAGVFRLTDHWIRVHPVQGGTATRQDESLRSQVRPLREFLRIIVTDNQTKADLAMERLAKGDAFFEVAHDVSMDATAPGGGYIGESWLAQMDPRLAAASAKLRHGETSGTVDMGDRWIILQRMPRDFKLDAERLFEQATALKARGDVKGALEEDQEALKIYPFFLRALIFMGVTLGETGSVQRGSEVLDLAARIYPKDSTTQFDLGLTLGGLGNHPGQIGAFRRAIALDPDNVAVYENLGAALYGSGDWQGALDACREGLTIDPLSAKLYFNLSMMLAEHGDTPGAERAKALAKQIDPEIAAGK